MSFYVAFPVHLVNELLALLPPDERSVYAEHFEPVVGNLVWLRDDAENAVVAALEGSEAPQARVWRDDLAVRKALTDRLMEVDNDALVGMMQDGLTTLARDLLVGMLAEQSRRNE